MIKKASQPAISKVNPIEKDPQLDNSSGASELRKTTKTIKDQLSGTGSDFISQLLGYDSTERSDNYFSGVMIEGQAIDLKSKRNHDIRTKKNQTESRRPEKRMDILGGINYRAEVIQGSERLSRSEAVQLENRIEDIMNELKRLIGSSGILKAEFAVLTVEDKPIKSGKYYTNFFEWLLLEVRKIRMKVEDAGAWLSVMKSKKSLKKYGAMAKKHGTSFTLNNERTPATQTG